MVIALYRSMLFRHQLLAQPALLLSALAFNWRHCVTLGCAYRAEFGAGAALLRWAELPALTLLPLRPRQLGDWWLGLRPAQAAEAAAAEGALGTDASAAQLRGCILDCFIVHGTMLTLLGLYVPLVFGEQPPAFWSSALHLRCTNLLLLCCPTGSTGPAVQAALVCLP